MRINYIPASVSLPSFACYWKINETVFSQNYNSPFGGSASQALLLAITEPETYTLLGNIVQATGFTIGAIIYSDKVNNTKMPDGYYIIEPLTWDNANIYHIVSGVLTEILPQYY